MVESNTFGYFFKKYRLRSEFESLSDFGKILADEGFIYEDSLFSHWQKGNRIPHDRKLLIHILKVFIQRQGISNLKEANELLESAGQGYLTNREIEGLPKIFLQSIPFQVPTEIEDFIGRKDSIPQVMEGLLNHKNILISGTAGSGKTALGIRIGHMLRDQFLDGVLWYSLETSSPMSILASIAFTFGKDIGSIKDIENRASIVRSLLSDKKILLILDGASKESRLDLFIPNSLNSSLLITSQVVEFPYLSNYKAIFLEAFTLEESFILFEKIMGEKYIQKNIKDLPILFNKVGNLPIALTILAKQLKNEVRSLKLVIKALGKAEIDLGDFQYGNKSLYSAFTLSFHSLNESLKKVFISLGIFDGPDFSLDAVKEINGLSYLQAKDYLNVLIKLSLVEPSYEKRYRMHTLIKLFGRHKITSDVLYKKAALYYVEFLTNIKDKNKKYHHVVTKEENNILFLIKKCFELKFWDEVVQLWHYFIYYMWNVGYWKELLGMNAILDKAVIKSKNIEVKVLTLVYSYGMIFYWQGEIKKTQNSFKKALKIALTSKNEDLINNIILYKSKIDCAGGKKAIQKSTVSFKKLYLISMKKKNYSLAIQACRYLGETNLVLKNFKGAHYFLTKTLEYSNKKIYQFIHTAYEKTAALNYLGGLSFLNEEYNESKNSFTLAIQNEKENLRRTGGIIWGNIGLGLTYEKLGQSFEAKECYKAAREEMELLGIKKNIEKVSLLLMALKNELHKSKLYKEYIISE
jgi:hypothetical protein